MTVYGATPSGHTVTLLAPPQAKAVVLYFVATDCPISNRTFPEMKRVREEFSTRDIAFWYVYPNTTETRDAVLDHQAAFDSAGQALLDDHGVLTELTHAVATPEAVVLTRSGSSWHPIYAGRIDDRYVRLGLERPSIQNHFVERVLNELLSGQPIEPAVGNPVGCAIMRPTAEKALRR
jgi:hypothetical protein